MNVVFHYRKSEQIQGLMTPFCIQKCRSEELAAPIIVSFTANYEDE